MNLYDEEEMRNKKEKNRKYRKYVITGIVLTTVSIIVLFLVIAFLIRNPNKITVHVNGKEDLKIEEMIKTGVSQEDDSTIVYFPIRTLAEYFGYKTYKGEYTTNEEDDNSCYIASGNEIAIFKVNTNTIYKRNLERRTNEYESITVKNPIKMIDNNLYIDIEGARKAFNMQISDYNSKTKRISIYTLDYWVATAENLVKSSKEKYKELEKSLDNKKALLDNIMIYTGTDGKKGAVVFSGTNQGREILGTQYDEITYLSQKQVFLVKRNNKYGIMGNDGKSDITIQYDELSLMDVSNNLYLAKKENKYGVIDINENVVIYLEYDRIGVDISQFSKNGVKNGYILLNSLIPVQQNGRWGFFRIEKQNAGMGTQNIIAKQITNIEFDGIGCITKAQNAIVSNIIVMQDYDVVVVAKNGYYGFMYSNGSPAIGLALSDLYMETSGGTTTYKIVLANTGETKEMLTYFLEHGINKKN